MRTPRLYIDPSINEGPSLREGQTVSLPPETTRYVLRVLRLKSNAQVVLFDGTGGEHPSRITRASRDAVDVEVGEHRDLECESPLRVRLAQGISRGQRMDLSVQKAVELGVTLIQPLLTSRGVVRLDGARADRRVAHWRSIAVHACEQCGRNRIPEIAPIETLATWLGRSSHPGTLVVLDPDAEIDLDALDRAGETATLLVGPEGGWTGAELESSVRAGFRAARIGPRTLRAETAAIAAVACVQTLWGDLGRSRAGD